MEEYFSKISPWEGEFVTGSIVTGEAGADMTAMKCILQIAEKETNFDYDKFFRAYAESYREFATLERHELILTDSHPLDYLRINAVLQQFDKFLETYDINEGDGMYLAPEDRVIVW